MLQEKDYLSVKEVAEMLDTEAYVLRFYEKELNLLIKRNNKGHRVYTLEDVELFRKIQDMREQGLQLKAIEGIVHAASGEARETYEQLTSIQIAPVSALNRKESLDVDIADVGDDKVKQFSNMMKDMFVQALSEYSEQSKWEMKETIKKEVDLAVEEKVSKIEEVQASQNAKSEEYYKKLDETMREVQKMRKEICESKEPSKKEKVSLWNKLFKEKGQSAPM